MAALVAADVTYTIVTARKSDRVRNKVKLVFGDGAKTYPSGGIPLTRANMGCPTVLEGLIITDPASANGYQYKYDSVNEKLRIYQGDNDNAADAPGIELLTSIAPAATTLYAETVGW